MGAAWQNLFAGLVVLLLAFGDEIMVWLHGLSG